MKREILNTMVKYNEKTIESMGMYLSKKIGIPSTSELQCIEWNHNSHFIATGGVQGTLKVVKLESSTDAVKGSNNLSVNQALDGHSTTIVCATWNENHQKLTTSDASGLIIVWGMHNDSWFEEMINNRNKSVVVGMGWNYDGTKIAIAYADGQVIVGTLEGNRIWNKDLPNALAACEWAPDGSNLIFGTTEGEVHIYDGTGNYLQKIHMSALDNVELVTALSKDLKREKIVCIKWYTPVIKSRLVNHNDKKTEYESEPPKIVEIYTFEQSESENRPMNDRPRFLVAYSHGVIQLMRAENDQHPIVCRFPNFTLTCARWSPNGAFIAVTGFQTDNPKNDQAVVHVISSFGKRISFLRVKETSSLTGVAWDPNGLRIAVTTDSNVYFGNIRPRYKWGYIGQTVVYVYEKEDEKNQFKIVFYETKLEEVFSKPVQQFEQIACHDDYCILVNKQDDQNGTYFAQLCNGIGTAMDFKYTNVEPECVALNSIAAVIAGGEHYFIWHFVLPKFNSVQSGIHVPGKEGLYKLDSHAMGNDTGNGRRRFGKGNDSIRALCMADSYFYAACESGALFKISLTDGAVLQRYSIPQNIVSMELNCTFTRLATLDNNNALQIFEIEETTVNKIPSLERRDVWSYKWDADKEDMLALNEKAKMIVLKGKEAEDPVNSSGYICSFKGLIVKTVLVDNFLLKPERPEKRFIHEIEIKSLRDVKSLLEKTKIQETTSFIEKNPHPRLWNLLAEFALNKLDIPTAEHAYVKLRDYAGIHFCKKLESIANEDLRRAEVHMHLSQFDKSEKIFLQNDRRDLALSMYANVHEWPQVVRLLTSEDDDTVKNTALHNVGDYYFERMQWEKAAEKYAQCNALEQRIESLVRGSILGELETLARGLPDHHEYLDRIGDVFTANGLCDQAVECFLRCGMVQKALSCCIELNFWERANQIAKTNNLADVDAMLAKYAENLTGASNEKSLSALQLYRRAGRMIDAAKICFDIAKDEHRRGAPPTRTKRIYVMGALLVEQMHQKKAGNKKEKPSARRLLEDTLNEEMDISIDESRIMESAWKGAEAFHFLILAHNHLFKQQPVDALRTALVLSEYEEYIDPSEIYCMIALAAVHVKQFALCSKAMMRLESLKEYTEDEKLMMRELAISIFSVFPPNEQQSAQVQCPSCDNSVKDFEMSCPKCDLKFPVCIASGRLILENHFWMCMSCKHRAYEHEIDRYRCCPLCHSTQSFQK